MQRELLAEDKLTFKKVCEIAQAIVLVKRNTCELKAAESRDVQAVNDRHKSVTKKENQFSCPGSKKSCCCGG